GLGLRASFAHAQLVHVGGAADVPKLEAVRARAFQRELGRGAKGGRVQRALIALVAERLHEAAVQVQVGLPALRAGGVVVLEASLRGARIEAEAKALAVA